MSEPIHQATDTITYTKPEAFTFRGNRHEVSTWKEVLIGVATALYDLHREEFERVLSLHGTKRAYFSRDERRMKFPREVSGSGIFVETNLNAKLIADICSDLLRLFGYSAEDLNIERSPVSFST